MISAQQLTADLPICAIFPQLHDVVQHPESGCGRADFHRYALAMPIQVTPQTVEFDVVLEDGKRAGSLVTWALPNHGDQLRVDDLDKQPIYEVVRCCFEPDNITVIVRPADEPHPIYHAREA